MKPGRIVSAMIAALGVAVLLFYLYTTNVDVAVKVIELCKRTCEGARANGVNLTNGPCLLNPMPTYPDWVCDVSHSPRLPVDAACPNMCSAYKEYNTFCPNSTTVGTANHFVEVAPDCSFIRAV